LGRINRYVNLSCSQFWGSLIFAYFPQFCPLVCTICQFFPIWFPGDREYPVEKVIKIQWDCIPCIFVSLFLFPTSLLSDSDLLTLHYSLPSCLLVAANKGACDFLWIIHNIFLWIITGGQLKLHNTIKLCLIFLYIFPELDCCHRYLRNYLSWPSTYFFSHFCWIPGNKSHNNGEVQWSITIFTWIYIFKLRKCLSENQWRSHLASEYST